MAKSTVKLNLKGLKKLQTKLKKYEQQTTISVPYSKEQWEQMTDYEKSEVKEQVITEYKNNIIKDLNNK